VQAFGQKCQDFAGMLEHFRDEKKADSFGGSSD